MYLIPPCKQHLTKYDRLKFLPTTLDSLKRKRISLAGHCKSYYGRIHYKTIEEVARRLE